MPRARRPASALVFALLTSFLPLFSTERSSSLRSPPLEDDAAELFRDAPLYPPLRDDLSPHDHSEILEQPHLLYDTETSIEESSILVTPEESNVGKESNILDVHAASNDDMDVENKYNTFGNSVPADNERIDSKLKINKPNYNDVISKTIPDELDLNLKNKDFVYDVDNVGVSKNGDYLNEDSFESPNESGDSMLSDINEDLENNILVGAENSDMESENTILMTSDDDIDGETSILLAPDIHKNFKEDMIMAPDDAVVEDEDSPFTQDSITPAENEIYRNNKHDPSAEDAHDAELDRVKRSQDENKQFKTNGRRVKTGDTILNIRGAVRDAIGDASAAPGPRASTRLDAFVIRPAPAPRPDQQDEPRDEPHPHTTPGPQQVQKQERELVVAAHSYVRIPCDLGNLTSVRWFKDNEPEHLSSTLPAAEGLGPDGALHIARVARPHAARWRCAGRDARGRPRTGAPTALVVHEAVRAVYLAVDGRRLDAGNTWVPVRDNTVLEVRCVAEGGVPPPELSWRLLALESGLDHRLYLRLSQTTNHSPEGVVWSRAVVKVARELHNATLQCVARQRRPETVAPAPAAAPAPAPAQAPASASAQIEHDDFTAKLEMHVTYPPSFVISRWPGFGVALRAGGAAALRCDVDANPPARAFWLRDDGRPSSWPAPEEAEDGGGSAGGGGSATLRWGALLEAHAGWYRCRASWLDAEYSSIGYYLNVLSPEDVTQPPTDAEPVEEPEHQKVDVPLGGNVQLNCPKGSVGCWWRRVVGNSSETWAPAGSHHAHGVLGIRGALYQEAGEYRCVGARAADQQRIRDLKRVTLRVNGGGGATATALSAAAAAGGGWRLECGACGRALRVLWLRAGRVLPAPALVPDLAQHCWRAVLLLPEPDEVWCVAVGPGGGAVAVFPRRALPAPPPSPASPAPARHAGRPLHSDAVSHCQHIALLLAVLLLR